MRTPRTTTEDQPNSHPIRTSKCTTGSGSLIRSLPAGMMEGPYSARFPSSPIGETSRRAPAGREAADERSPCRPDATGPAPASHRRIGECRRPTMAQDAPAYEHRPVMVDRIVELLGVVPAGILVDATVGGGGHARALLEARPDLRLIGLDQDRDALEASSSLVDEFGSRAVLVQARFDRLREVVGARRRRRAGDGRALRPRRQLAAARPGRPGLQLPPGRSARHADGPASRAHRRRHREHLPPRPSSPSLLRRYGDERYSVRIARAVVAARPVTSTTELAEVVREAIPAPARRRGGHPAKRTFQAIRIEVNRELDILPGRDRRRDRPAGSGGPHRRARRTTRVRTASSRSASARPRPVAARALPACPACAGPSPRCACSGEAAGPRTRPSSRPTREPRAPDCEPRCASIRSTPSRSR